MKTKKIINESQLHQIVAEATKMAIARIIQEGAGTDVFLRNLKDGFNNEFIEDEGWASRYIKNGDNGGTDWDSFERDRREYNAARKNHQKKTANRKEKDKNSDSYSTAELDRAHDAEKNAKGRREDAAFNAIGSRPGIVGKGQRAAAVGALKAGQFGKKMKKGATNFLHNKIGIGENKK